MSPLKDMFVALSSFSRNRVFFLSLLIIGALFFKAPFWGEKREPFSFPITISDESRTPFTTVHIEGHDYSVLIDLGSKHHIALIKQDLDPLQKEQTGEVSSTDIFGRTSFSKCYNLPQVHVGEKQISSCEITEETPVCTWTPIPPIPPTYGHIGRKFLLKENLLLNLSQKTMEHRSCLKNKKHCLARLPIEISPLGVLISVETHLGTKKFMLDTGATHNFLRISEVPLEKQQNYREGLMCYKSQIYLGENQFPSPKETFVLAKFTEKLSPINGILGIDFLERYKCFFDFSNKELFLYSNERL